MALNKVEICGVNTSKLPVLKTEEKEELFPGGSKKGMNRHGSSISKEIWRLVLKRDPPFSEQQRKPG